MKLAGRQANGYFAKPETNRSGLLIYGADAMRVALKRQQVIAALIGPEGEAEMRDSVARTGANPARRALRATFDDLTLNWTHDSNPRLVFTLGRGCYATSLLRELVLFDLP